MALPGLVRCSESSCGESCVAECCWPDGGAIDFGQAEIENFWRGRAR